MRVTSSAKRHRSRMIGEANIEFSQVLQEAQDPDDLSSFGEGSLRQFASWAQHTSMRVISSAKRHRSRMIGDANIESSQVLWITKVLRPPLQSNSDRET